MNLIYVNNGATDQNGAPHPFVAQEREWLVDHFDRAVGVCFHGAFGLDAQDADGQYALDRRGLASLYAWLTAPFSRDLWRGLGRLRKDGRLSAVSALKLFAFVKRGRKLHRWLERLLGGMDVAQTTLYAFWTSYDAYAAALSKRKHPQLRFVARGHAYDIDAARNPMNPYLMKDEIAACADGLYPISDAVKEQLLSYMRGRLDESRVHVLAMGSYGEPVPLAEPPCLADGVLRVLSCANVLPIKQVDMLASALAGWAGGPAHWTHIGGGEGLEALRALAEQKLDPKPNVICDLKGAMTQPELRDFYAHNAFDLFVNTSKREGVPVSIMEAMRYGVPFVAPDVGGVPELAAGGAGYLYAPEDGAAGVRAAIARFASLSLQGMRDMRRAAKARWDADYQSGVLLGRLFPEATKEE